MSWFNSKKSVGPAHPSSESRHGYYDPNQVKPSSPSQQAMWNSQQDPYWHQVPVPSTLPGGNGAISQNVDGEHSWNWNSNATHMSQYNVPCDNTDYYYGNTNSQMKLGSNSDPWNWGVDESSNDATCNNNAETADPSWDWSVDSSSYQQQPPMYMENSVPYQQHTGTYTEPSNIKHEKPIRYKENSTAEQNQTTMFTKTPTSFQQHAGDFSGSLSSGEQYSDSALAQNKVATYIDNPTEMKQHPNIHSERPTNHPSQSNLPGCADTSSLYQHSMYTVSSGQQLPNPDQFQETLAVSTQILYNVKNEGSQVGHTHSGQDFNLPNEKNVSNENSNQVEHNFIKNESKELIHQQVVESHAIASVLNNKECNNAPFSDNVPDNGSQNSSNNVFLNTYLVSNPSVLSDVTNKGKEVEVVAKIIHNELCTSNITYQPRQLLGEDSNVVNNQETDVGFSVFSKHSSVGLTPQWSTESLPSQGSDEVVHTLEGSGNELPTTLLSPVSQSPCLPETQQYEDTQPDNYNSFGKVDIVKHERGNPISENLSSSVEGNKHFEPDYHLLNQPHSVAALSQVLHNLHVDNSGTKLEEVNREIAPPESNYFQQSPMEPTVPANTLLSGPPKANATHVSKNQYAPYNKHLNHKSVNMYSISGHQSTTSGDEPNVTASVTQLSQGEDLNILYTNDSRTSTTHAVNSLENSSSTDRTRMIVNADEEVNLETLPENKERPDFAEVEKPLSPISSARSSNTSSVHDTWQWSPQAATSVSPDNQEVAPRCGPDRNQYLETGQLSDDEVSEVSQYGLREPGSWSSLQRMVPGQLTGNEPKLSQSDTQIPTEQTFNEDVSTPPPGLHRMVPGQTEQDCTASSAVSDTLSQAAGGDTMLQRMVPGQMTDEDSVIVSAIAGEEIPPPGLRRMVPGESSSPESQVIGSSQQTQTFQPITSVPMEARVVTGVSREEVDGTDNQAALGAAVPSAASPAPDLPVTNKTQPTSERSETIGSDSIETYQPPAIDNSAREGSSSTRRESGNERDRRHRDDESMEERESRRRVNHSNYRERECDRERDREDSGSGRYEQGKRSHRTERDHLGRHGETEWREGGRRSDEHRRNRDEIDSYEKKRKDRDRSDRQKPPRERGRRDESPDARRYRDDRTHDKKRYDKDSYPNYHANQDDRRRYGRRAEYHNDTGSEYSDYERHEYDGRAYDRRDYHRRDKTNYRHHDDYGRYREDSRHYQDPRTHFERKKLDSQDRVYRESQEYWRDSREVLPSSQFCPPLPAFPGFHHGPAITEYLNYYNNLRAHDPAAYAEWFNSVYKHMSYQPQTYSEDRGSVHSGRSSANSGRYNRDRELEQTTTSVTEDHPTMSPHRLTPSKFATAHVKATLTRKGQLIKVLPHYPLDGQPAMVELHDIQGLFVSEEPKNEFTSFPGPLVKGITHKNSLIAFCNSKIRSCEQNIQLFDRESIILLWELLILLLRQNGTVVGTDVAELLLNNSRVPIISSRPSTASSHGVHSSREHFPQEEGIAVTSNKSVFNLKSEEELTNTFREYLLYGNTKEALEWAMKNGLWGHALFLASKMDQRTYANVMTRFANGLSMNDPLQTLYQLMSGRQPAAVTCCADEKWGDWRPHLAMILSNSSTQRLDLNHKSITVLGDTLGTHGCLHAAHFVYLMAQVSFGTYANKGSKIVLLGSSHHKSFLEFATNEAIQMTEIYEYANRLADSEFVIPTLQPYKLLYGKRLAEQGLVMEALQYAEELSNVVLRHPEQYGSSFIQDIYELGDSLKYSDPYYSCAGENVLTEDVQWLMKLKQIIENINYGQTFPDYGSMTNVSYTDRSENFHQGSLSVDHSSHLPEVEAYDYNWQQPTLHSEPQPSQTEQSTYLQPYPDSVQDQWIDHNQQPEQCTQNQESNQQLTDLDEAHSQPPEINTNQNHQSEWQNTPQSVSQWETQGHSTMIGDGTAIQEKPFSSYWEQSANHEELSTPQITLPNAVSQKSEKVQGNEDDFSSRPGKTTQSKKKKDEPKSNTSSGWFGGLWNKLALSSKNQMKLPDDKNPTIVWDSEKKRWTNLEEDVDSQADNLPPPPKASLPAATPNSTLTSPKVDSLHPAVDYPNANGVPTNTTSSAPNMYKMSRGRSSRSNYVDILGGSKTPTQSLPAPLDIFPLMTTKPPANMNFFIPGTPDVPVTSIDPSPPATAGLASDALPDQSEPSMQHLSRWSSTSSLSREVQSYMARGRHSVGLKSTESSQGYGAPLMFNPNDYSQPVNVASKVNSHYRNRYPQL